MKPYLFFIVFFKLLKPKSNITRLSIPFEQLTQVPYRMTLAAFRRNLTYRPLADTPFNYSV